jgi:hypothetical protein
MGAIAVTVVTPKYAVSVSLYEDDHNWVIASARVARVLRDKVGDQEANQFWDAALLTTSYTELLGLIKATVEVV